MVNRITAPTGSGSGIFTVKSNNYSWFISPVAARIETRLDESVAAVLTEYDIPVVCASTGLPSLA